MKHIADSLRSISSRIEAAEQYKELKDPDLKKRVMDYYQSDLKKIGSEAGSVDLMLQERGNEYVITFEFQYPVQISMKNFQGMAIDEAGIKDITVSWKKEELMKELEK